jgi:hypothetical protein
MLKYKDDYDAFKTLVFIQLIFIVSILVGKEVFRSAGYSLQDVFPKCFYLLVSGLYGFSLFNITQFTTQNKKTKQAIGLLIIIIFISTFMVDNPFYPIQSNQRLILGVIHILLLLLEMIVLVIAIKDLLSPNKTLNTKLWASLGTYFTILISWGGLYDLMSLIIPGCLGNQHHFGLENYAECISYSFGIVSKDDGIMSPIPLIKQLSKVQTLWCSMFMIFLFSQFKTNVKKD